MSDTTTEPMSIENAIKYLQNLNTISHDRGGEEETIIIITVRRP